MNSKLVFFLLCIPARILLAWYSQHVVDLRGYSFILFAIAIGTLYLWYTNKRLDAPEAGGKTWWSEYRLIIGLLYLAAGIYAYQGKRDLVWIPLAIDIAFGIILQLFR